MKGIFCFSEGMGMREREGCVYVVLTCVGQGGGSAIGQYSFCFMTMDFSVLVELQ